MSSKDTCIYLGQALADYGFKDGHPFGPQRHDAFKAELIRQGLDKELAIQTPVAASSDRIALFHTADYLDKVPICRNEHRDDATFDVGHLCQPFDEQN